MSSKLVLGGTFIVFITVLGVAYFTLPSTTVAPITQPAAVTDSPSATTSDSTAGSSTAGNTSGYTLAQVATHNNSSSCWAAINGNVYDLTNWINQHPGGPEHILNICGTDGSASFNGQHSGQSQPQQELANFLIGPLVQ